MGGELPTLESRIHKNTNKNFKSLNEKLKSSNILKYLHLCVGVYERCASEKVWRRERFGERMNKN